MVTDLLEHGAVSKSLITINGFEDFLTEFCSTVFKERRSISFIDPFLLCLIQLFLHHHPFEDYSLIIKQFIELVYIQVIFHERNNDILKSSINEYF